MTAYIFVWCPTNEHIGHVSLRAAPDLYISFWPRDQGTILGTVPSKGVTYDEDCEYEGHEDAFGDTIPRPPSEMIDVQEPFRDIDRLRSWWDDFQNSGFDLATNNCCSAVRKALHEGNLPWFEISRLVSIVDSWEKEFTRQGMFSWIFGGPSKKKSKKSSKW